jgi:hypothetical protein
MSIKEYLKKLISKDSDSPEHFTNAGTTGTAIYSGYYSEEYLRTFQDMPSGIDVYDKMRRQDYQVAMLLRGVKTPIIAANWGVIPVDDSDLEKDIASFVEYCLFEDISYPDSTKSKTFRDFLTEALTCIDFGYALFEPVYKVVTGHPIWGNYVGLRDIAFRSPKTIYEWNLNSNGSIKNVRQLVSGDLYVDIQIPGENLMCITNQKEGDNYQGISMLRPIYGNYLRKDFYFKIQAMGIERCATGVLTGVVPIDSKDDLNKIEAFKTILKRYTSHESNFLMIPPGFQVDVTKIDFDAATVETAIDSEDKRMAKSFLAGFLELGLGGQAGSQSLGKDLSTIFLNGIEIFSENIADAVEKNIIKKLVDSKFGKRVKYPQLKATDIATKGSKERAEVAAILKNAGLISPSDQLEDVLNRDYDFPVRTQEQKDQARQDSLTNDINITSNFSDNLCKNNHITLSESDNASLYIKRKTEDIRNVMKTELTIRYEEFIKKVKKQFVDEKKPNKRRKILEDTIIPGHNDYLTKVRLPIASITVDSVNKVLKELKIKNIKFDDYNNILENVPKQLREKLKSVIQFVVDDQDNELKKRMVFAISQKLDTTDSIDSLMADMRFAAENYVDISTLIDTAAKNLVSNTVNSARNEVFQTPGVFEEIESFVIVNPSPDALICQNLVGRVFSKDEYKTADLPPYHHNCETTVKAQLVGQKGNKPINPIGLKPTGSQEEIEKILKSKKF